MKSILLMVPTFLFDVIDNCGFPKELSTFIIVDSKGLYTFIVDVKKIGMLTTFKILA